VQFERPSFDEIKAAIQRTFPMPGSPSVTLTPASFDRYFESGGIQLQWHRIPDWESYEYGNRDIPDEEFVTLLFSPKRPKINEAILIVTDECFQEQKGFRVLFGDLPAFARHDYPQMWRPIVHLFQPLDLVFIAEESRLLVLLYHEGQRAQFAG
jgi:hypothetical protein